MLYSMDYIWSVMVVLQPFEILSDIIMPFVGSDLCNLLPDEETDAKRPDSPHFVNNEVADASWNLNKGHDSEHDISISSKIWDIVD